MLAYALVLTWYHKARKGVNYHEDGQITRNGLGVLGANLHATKDHGLANLLWLMLSGAGPENWADLQSANDPRSVAGSDCAPPQDVDDKTPNSGLRSKP